MRRNTFVMLVVLLPTLLVSPFSHSAPPARIFYLNGMIYKTDPETGILQRPATTWGNTILYPDGTSVVVWGEVTTSANRKLVPTTDAYNQPRIVSEPISVGGKIGTTCAFVGYTVICN